MTVVTLTIETWVRGWRIGPVETKDRWTRHVAVVPEPYQAEAITRQPVLPSDHTPFWCRTTILGAYLASGGDL